MLLGVVEENRKKEVMENLEVCAELVDKIRTKITELEGIVWVNSSYHKTSEAFIWITAVTFPISADSQ